MEGSKLGGRSDMTKRAYDKIADLREATAIDNADEINRARRRDDRRRGGLAEYLVIAGWPLGIMSHSGFLFAQIAGSRVARGKRLPGAAS